MNVYDLLEAMSGIREQYIEEAAVKEAGSENVSASEEKAVKKRRSFGKRTLRFQSWAAGAAALVFLSVLVPNVSPEAAWAFQNLPVVGQYFRMVTFRSYEYRDAVSDAVVEEAQVIVMSAGESAVEEAGSAGEAADESGFMAQDAEAENFAGEKGSADKADTESPAVRNSAEAASSSEATAAQSTETDDSASSAEAVLAAAQVTEEIRTMAQDSIKTFEKSISEETGYHAMRFLCDKVTDTDGWLCLSVLSYTSSADGFEQVTHFVINKKTGRRVFLADCFPEGADFVTPISDNIKEQMRSRMKNPDNEYWIDSEDSTEEDFNEISKEQDFYINDQGDLVICFNEMEVAPMYMGTVEFVIPRKVTEGIGKGMTGK